MSRCGLWAQGRDDEGCLPPGRALGVKSREEVVVRPRVL